MACPSFRGLALACMAPCILVGPAAALHMQPILAMEAPLADAKPAAAEEWAAAATHAAPAKAPGAEQPRQAKAVSKGAQVEGAEGHSGHVGDLSLIAVAPQTDILPAAHTRALPSAGDVLSLALQPLAVFSTTASEMQRKAAEMQNASKRNLTLLRKHYQGKLSTLKAEHEELVKETEQLRSDISAVNATNDGLEKQAKDLERSIDLVHGTFLTLQDRVNMAEGFIDDSLNATGVDGNPSVQVLVVTTPEPTLEDYVLQAWHGLGLDNSSSSRLSSTGAAADAAEELDNFATLLQVSSGATMQSHFEEEENSAFPKDPSKMTSLLLRTLEKLSTAEQTASYKLKEQYQRTRAKWVEQNGELFAEKARLRSQLDAVTTRGADLLAVKKTLTHSNNILKEKLGEFVGFLSFLDMAAASAVAIADGHADAEASN